MLSQSALPGNSSVSVQLDNDTVIKIIPVEQSESYSQVSPGLANASMVFNGIKELSMKLKTVLEEACPDEASVEFSVGFSAKSSELLAIIVDAEAKGSIKVILTWKKKN